MIFSTQSYAAMAARVGQLARVPLGEVETRVFADGERYLRLRSDPRGTDATVLGGTVSDDGDNSTTIHNFSGSLIFRAPMDAACLAPYLYVGGGCSVDGHQWASAHAGAGVEYRIVPQKVGVFLDGRWTYLGDRFGHEDLNYFSTRLGMRFVF